MNLYCPSWTVFDLIEGVKMSDPLEGWGEFPKIGLIVEGNKKFFSLREAIPLWDRGMLKVEDTGEVLLKDFSIRAMTAEENCDFQSRVDDYSANK